MAALEFGIPKGAILFTEGEVAYEFREDLGEANHGLRLLMAQCHTPRGPGGKRLLKAVGLPRGEAAARVLRARAKLEEEVRLATRLQHPSILRVYGLHKAEGAWYAITEPPSGNSLKELMALASERERWFSAPFALYVGLHVAQALEHAHTLTDEHGRPLGIVHRAIDLDRISVSWSGRVQVADFGLALSALPGRVASTVQRPLGDSYFTSPEILLGARADARSDLFALGLVLLELTTGKNLLHPPEGVSPAARAALSRGQRQRVARSIRRAKAAGFGDDVEEVIWRAATYTPAQVDAVTAPLPAGLRTLLRSLLARSRRERLASARDAARALAVALDGVRTEAVVAELHALVTEAGARLATELDVPPPPPGPRAPDAVTTR